MYISGDLRDDSQPEFLREFHKALAVVSGDLFFARYRFQSETAHSLKEKSSASTLSAAKGMLIHVSLRDSMHTMSYFDLLIFVYFCHLTIWYYAVVAILQELFGECYNEEEKAQLVEDLLDLTLLPSTDEKGVIFTKQRLHERSVTIVLLSYKQIHTCTIHRDYNLT